VTHFGTLDEWAKAWEHSHYSGDGHPSSEVITWHNRDGYKIQVDRLGKADDDWIDYRIRVAGEQASVRIDGRA
jgi:hypothetical protein